MANPKLIIDALMKLFGGAGKQVDRRIPGSTFPDDFMADEVEELITGGGMEPPLTRSTDPRTLSGGRANTNHPDFDPGEFYGGNLPERRVTPDRRIDPPLDDMDNFLRSVDPDDLNVAPDLPMRRLEDLPMEDPRFPTTGERRNPWTRPSDVDQIRPDLIDELIMAYVRVFKRSPTPAQIRNPRDMAYAITDHEFIKNMDKIRGLDIADPRSRMNRPGFIREKNPDNSPVTLTPDDFDDIPF